MTIRSKVRNYKNCVRLVMTYAVETGAENTTKRYLTGREMKK